MEECTLCILREIAKHQENEPYFHKIKREIPFSEPTIIKKIKFMLELKWIIIEPCDDKRIKILRLTALGEKELTDEVRKRMEKKESFLKKLVKGAKKLDDSFGEGLKEIEEQMKFK